MTPFHYKLRRFIQDRDSNSIREGPEGKIEAKVDYISVPVLAKIYVTDGLSFEVGPQFNFKVNEQLDDESAAGGIDTDGAENFEFAVAGGVTFQTSIGLFATGRYTYGLTNAFKEDAFGPGTGDVDAKNSVFQIGVGYKF
ncbi:outer membrane beta-barrel protein [Flavobacterium sp. 3HN19-14]|uniref:outer membrane beta-barrel protein n=1 Tax=Flavobacterium sp. 3HN19-14 TaxID=3448133 RepID=UPI003EE04F12